MTTRTVPAWTKSMPGQYGSNGINTDGSCMNVGNTLGDRPSIKLFPKYNSGNTMRALLADCGGLGDGLAGDILNSHKVKQSEQSALHAESTSSNNTKAFLPTHTNIPEKHSKSSLQKNSEKMSPLEAQRSLWEAARQGNTQLVKAALHDGADAMKPNPTDGWLALHYAASNNRRLTCKLLLSLPTAGQQCTHCNKTGEVPIKLCTNSFLKNMLREASEQ